MYCFFALNCSRLTVRPQLFALNCLPSTNTLEGWQEEDEDSSLSFNSEWQKAQRAQFERQQKASEEAYAAKKRLQEEYRKQALEKAEKARLARVKVEKENAVKEVKAEKIRNQFEALKAEQRDLEAENRCRAQAEHQKKVSRESRVSLGTLSTVLLAPTPPHFWSAHLDVPLTASLCPSFPSLPPFLPAFPPFPPPSFALLAWPCYNTTPLLFGPPLPFPSFPFLTLPSLSFPLS